MAQIVQSLTCRLRYITKSQVMPVAAETRMYNT